MKNLEKAAAVFGSESQKRQKDRRAQYATLVIVGASAGLDRKRAPGLDLK